MIAIVREYPLVSHCPVVALILKSAMIGGSAVFSAVDSIEPTTQQMM